MFALYLIRSGKLVDLDAYVFGRLYDYMGHVVRMGFREKQFLPYLALCRRDKSWCLQHQEILGHQGHAKRVHPWTHERPYCEYFNGHGLDWKEAALDKTIWRSHKSDWICSVSGRKCSAMKLF